MIAGFAFAHERLHVALPAHVTVQSPWAHTTLHVLLPVQSTDDDAWSVTLQVLPPPQVIFELAPALRLQLLWPSQVTVELSPMAWLQLLIDAHDTVQLLPHAPLHADALAQCEVQFEPQLTLHVFDFAQSNVMSEGAGWPPSSSGPSVQTLPDAQLHWVAVQVQLPVQLGGLFLPQAVMATDSAATTIRLRVNMHLDTPTAVGASGAIRTHCWPRVSSLAPPALAPSSVRSGRVLAESHPTMSDELAQVEHEHREALAALDAARRRWERAAAESAKVCEPAGSVPPPEPAAVPAPSSIAIDAALGRYTDALKSLAKDDSGAARERCVRALAEYDTLCAKAP